MEYDLMYTENWKKKPTCNDIFIEGFEEWWDDSLSWTKKKQNKKKFQSV